MARSEIDAVLERLGRVIDETRKQSSRAGYFAAMYHKVTVAVKDAVAAGRFDDGDRMAHLDRVFAERYLDAYDTWRNRREPTGSWQAAFAATGRWRPVIVQHLLTGMNAHINLDLGIAAATVAPGAELPSLRRDFDTINDVLATLVDGFTKDVADVSPWIGWLDRFGGRTDQALIRFSIEAARRHSWELAERLAAVPADQWADIIDRRDRATAKLTRRILSPGPILPIGLFLIRVRESNDVPRVIDLLLS